MKGEQVAAPEERGPCSVYVMASGGLMKVGVSSSVDDRRRALEAQRGVAVSVLATVEFPTRRAALDAEGALHRRFASIRQKGEWFLSDPKIPSSLAALSGRHEPS